LRKKEQKTENKSLVFFLVLVKKSFCILR